LCFIDYVNAGGVFCERLSREHLQGVFAFCPSLRTGIQNTRLELVEAGMFAGCFALTAADLPDTVTTIGAAAFAHCAALEVVGLSDSRSPEVAALTFANTGSLRLPPLRKSAFFGCSTLFDVGLPVAMRALLRPLRPTCAAAPFGAR
jgi:hypothetical protein